ncbi:hypothetical protein WJX73_006701 [Symbiochloris irregularis]|uniref:Uncharacterized protein n=1 Tax=Symbiochloris irregularis TaxID=706552 RepID=A0AAW1NWF3_9CHLO
MGCAGSKGPPARPADVKGVRPPAPEPQPTIPRVKLVLLGDSGVGKSCLVLRYVRRQFDPQSQVTVGAAFMSHSVHLPDGSTVKFEIWDTAGQERYASLAPLYYRGAAAAAIVYDITNPDSFQKAKHWVGELKKNAGDNIVIVLVGNKSDLVENRVISIEDGEELASQHSMLFAETSAKTAAGVSTVFELIAQKFASPAASGPAEARPPAASSSPAESV